MKFDTLYEKLSKKEYFRIKYPYSARPRLRINESEHEIIDISEWGIRFHNNKEQKSKDFKENQIIKGVIIFQDNAHLECEGKVLRISGHEITAQLKERIPYDRIMKEQLNILKNFANKINF